jgi:predicted nucleotide-binding protein
MSLLFSCRFMAKKQVIQRESAPSSLLKSRTEVEAQLDSRIKAGQELLAKPIKGSGDIQNAQASHAKWNEYNSSLLKRLFGGDEFQDQYDARVFTKTVAYPNDLGSQIGVFQETVRALLLRLESIRERTEMLDEPSLSPSAIAPPYPASVPHAKPKSNNVFVVHSHDAEMERAVGNALLRLGLDPIVLHEKPNKGATIIEKFEANADMAEFAVILMSPDDIGRSSKSENAELRHRARQNVILEMGYFIGALKRKNVMVLLRGKDVVETPSDILGVAYEPFNESGQWKNKLVQELKAAGFTLRDADLTSIEVAPLELQPLSAVVSAAHIPESLDDGDIRALISSWWHSLHSSQRKEAQNFASVDRQLNLPPGSAKRLLELTITSDNYSVKTKGKNYIIFEFEVRI